MKFIKLTYRHGSGACYVNPALILYLGLGGKDRGTFVYMCGLDYKHNVEVKETQQQILDLIEEALIGKIS